MLSDHPYANTTENSRGEPGPSYNDDLPQHRSRVGSMYPLLHRAVTHIVTGPEDRTIDEQELQGPRCGLKALHERPSCIGPYMIKQQIGSGGMGLIYLANRSDDEFRKQVAIKVLRRGSSETLEFYFRQERQILADLDHPHVCRLIDGGTIRDGSPYFVME